MSIATEGLTGLAHKAKRPLPPEVEFAASSATFSGKAEPATSVRLIDSIDHRTRSAMADANGDWKITLDNTPRYYTQFEIRAYDPETAACSDAVKYIFGGRQPKLFDVYAGQTLAFGQSEPGTKITMLGADGQVLGQSFTFGKHGVWTVRFRDAVLAGAKLCVLAESSDGSVSTTSFTEAKPFAVTERNVGCIAGSGADPGDRIAIFDAASGQAIAATTAGDTGAWSLSFDEPLEAGMRVAVERTHVDGTTAKGPVFTAIKYDCLAPVITTFSGGQLGGMAEPGLRVVYAQYRNRQKIQNGNVIVESNGLWTSNDIGSDQPMDFQAGDVLVAKTTNDGDTEESLIPASITIGAMRPSAPLVLYIDQNGAWGYAQRLKNILISTEGQGLIWIARSGWNGYWSVDWTQAVGSLATTTRVFFEVLDSWLLTQDAQTSTATVRYADAEGKKPARPVIDTYIPTDIAGTEATAGTVVVVTNHTDFDQNINSGGAPLTNNRWEVKPSGSNIPKDDDEIFAVAWTLSDKGEMEVDSDPSTSVYIDSYVPPEPTVTYPYPDDIAGTEPVLPADSSELPYIVVHISYASSQPRQTIADSGHLVNGRLWSTKPSPSLQVGDHMVAWAQTDAGAKSAERPFKITAGAVVKTAPPMITKWDKPTISGTGPSNTIITLYQNGINKGIDTVDVSQGYSWSIDIGTTPRDGDVLKAIATDQNGYDSDPFYILVGDTPTVLTVEKITTSALTANVTTANQRLLAWRASDGLKVIDHLIGGPGTYAVGYLPNVTIKTDDLIYCSSMDTTYSSTNGSMAHYYSEYVPYSA